MTAERERLRGFVVVGLWADEERRWLRLEKHGEKIDIELAERPQASKPEGSYAGTWNRL